MEKGLVSFVRNGEGFDSYEEWEQHLREHNIVIDGVHAMLVKKANYEFNGKMYKRNLVYLLTEDDGSLYYNGISFADFWLDGLISVCQKAKEINSSIN